MSTIDMTSLILWQAICLCHELYLSSSFYAIYGLAQKFELCVGSTSKKISVSCHITIISARVQSVKEANQQSNALIDAAH